jgi:RNase H-fold protein (predicted Holliday junction resolvase)
LQNTTEVAWQIARICEAEGAQQLVLGLPLDKDGSETKQADITRKFAQTLAVICLEWMGPNFTLWFWDERYTSKFAMARLQNSKTATASYRAADFSRAWIDADSACIILEDFYSLNGDGAERIIVTCPETRMECLKRWEQRQEQKQAVINLHNQQRGISVTARKDAMMRVKEREEQLSKDGITYTSSKAKAKKRRKKSSGWITL